MLAAILIVSLLLWLLAQYHPWEKYTTDNIMRCHGNISAATFGEILLRMFGALFTQGLIEWHIHGIPEINTGVDVTFMHF